MIKNDKTRSRGNFKLIRVICDKPRTKNRFNSEKVDPFPQDKEQGKDVSSLTILGMRIISVVARNLEGKST